jgi:hypothetical protein
VLAQFTAVGFGGAALAFFGSTLTVIAVAMSLPATDFGSLVPAEDVAQIIAASTFAGAVGAVMGGGIGALVRNTGGAVTTAVLVLIILLPLAVQLVSDAASWIPNTLAGVISGVGSEGGVLAAIAAIAVWGLVPAAAGLVSVQRRDVV